MKKGIFITLLFIGIPVLLFLSGTVFVVKETQYCVITTLGDISAVHTKAGLYLRDPTRIVQQARFFPAQAITFDSPPENVVTGDQKKLIVDNYVKWAILKPDSFMVKLGSVERGNNRVSIITHDALKDVLAQRELRNIIASDREEISRLAMEKAIPRAAELGMKILDIRIKKVELPDVNVGKAYERMNAERYKEANTHRSRGEEESMRIKAQTDKDIAILEAEAYKQAQLLKADADAKAADIYSKAFNRDPDFYSFYRSLETLKKTADTSTTLIISPKSELYKYLVGK